MSIQHPGDGIPFVSEFQSKFKITKILGKGAYGCVFEAEKNVMGKVKWKRAVKRIPLPKRVEEIEKALKEVEAMVSFNHVHIVKCYDAWTEEPPHGWQREQDEKMLYELNSNEHFAYRNDCAFLYIQMERCESTLAEWLAHNEHRKFGNMMSRFEQIVSAVAYIHEMGQIHRDLKPSNILIASNGQMRVCDMGIMSDRVTEPAAEPYSHNLVEIPKMRTMNMGTDLYMAPEQTRLTETSSKVDVFALGLILAEMCVTMSVEEKEEVFNVLRGGECDTVLLRQIFKILQKEAIFSNFDEMSASLKQMKTGCSQHRIYAFQKSSHNPHTLEDIVNNILNVQSFVSWLANANESKRPSCNTVLKHSFFKRIESYRWGGDDLLFSSKFAANYETQKIIGQADYDYGGIPLNDHTFIHAFEARNLKDDVVYKVCRKAVKIEKISRVHVRCSFNRLYLSKTADEVMNDLQKLESLKHENIVEIESWMEDPPKGWQHRRDDFDLLPLGWWERFKHMHYFPDDYKAFIYTQMEPVMTTLEDWLRENQSRDLDQSKTWFKQLLSAVSYLHQKNMFHGSIMPSNILIDTNNNLKLGGLAFAVGIVQSTAQVYDVGRGTCPVHPAGSHKYRSQKLSNQTFFTMPPSQYAPHIGTHCRTEDVFKLGLVLTELIVCMSDEESIEVFENYRCGRPNTILNEQPQVEELVDWITDVDVGKRRSCKEILAHEYLM